LLCRTPGGYPDITRLGGTPGAAECLVRTPSYSRKGKSVAPISERLNGAEDSVMTKPEVKQLKPFLRDAVVSVIPEMTDDQLVRIARALTTLHPHTLVSRLTDFTALVQGIPVQAETEHEANRATWAMISDKVREVLDTPADVGTELTSIDVRPPAQSMFDLD
jgi:hypothetical protein